MQYQAKTKGREGNRKSKRQDLAVEGKKGHIRKREEGGKVITRNWRDTRNWQDTRK